MAYSECGHGYTPKTTLSPTVLGLHNIILGPVAPPVPDGARLPGGLPLQSCVPA